MNKILCVSKGISAVGLCAVFLYSWSFLSISTIHDWKIRNHKIKPTELEMVIQREKEKLNLNAEISVTIDDTITYDALTECRQSSENKYHIKISTEALSPVAIRHELYHIAKGDCKYRGFVIPFHLGGVERVLDFRYTLIEEPRATLYAVTGIRL